MTGDYPKAPKMVGLRSYQDIPEADCLPRGVELPEPPTMLERICGEGVLHIDALIDGERFDVWSGDYETQTNFMRITRAELLQLGQEIVSLAEGKGDA